LIRWSAVIGLIFILNWMAPRSFARPDNTFSSENLLAKDQAASIRFIGSPTADLFTKELDASFQGVLEKSFVEQARDGYPAGFINASLPGFPWAGTMWSRDGGTFMREL
jgi:hypothetical protein